MPNPDGPGSLRKKQLTYVKYLLNDAQEAIRSASPLVVAVGLLRLHDSIEMFQLAVLDKIGVESHGGFMGFWEAVKNGTKTPLPYKDRFSALNKLRNAFKHQAILPNPDEVKGLADIVPSFFVEVCEGVLELDFDEVSLADLISDKEVRRHVKVAEELDQNRKGKDALAELAIAMDILLRTVREKVPERTRFSSELFRRRAVSYDLIVPRVFNEPGLGRLSSLVESLKGIQSQIQEIQDVVEMGAWGINLDEYARFRGTTPIVQRTLLGESSIVWPQEITPTDDDGGFCLQFVIRTALNVELRGLCPTPHPPS